MPAGQVYRLVRQQRQQQRIFDPNLLGLQLADSDPLTTGTLVVDQVIQSATRWRNKADVQHKQWPVYPRMQATDLQLADQPLIDLEPWSPPTAAYQGSRSMSG